MPFLSRSNSAAKDNYWQQHWVHDLLAACSQVLNIQVCAGFPCSFIKSYHFRWGFVICIRHEEHVAAWRPTRFWVRLPVNDTWMMVKSRWKWKSALRLLPSPLSLESDQNRGPITEAESIARCGSWHTLMKLTNSAIGRLTTFGSNV
jgi:hypothetical protein